MVSYCTRRNIRSTVPRIWLWRSLTRLFRPVKQWVNQRWRFSRLQQSYSFQQWYHSREKFWKEMRPWNWLLSASRLLCIYFYDVCHEWRRDFPLSLKIFSPVSCGTILTWKIEAFIFTQIQKALFVWKSVIWYCTFTLHRYFRMSILKKCYSIKERLSAIHHVSIE